MKYIASYPLFLVDPVSAQKQEDAEFYKTPHGSCNGRSLGKFKMTTDGLVSVGLGSNYEEGSNGWGVETPVKDEWVQILASDLMDHLRVGDINMGAGYSVWVSDDGTRVLAESYTACSGNFVGIIHRATESVLYINSYRHGIPGLARQFYGVEPTKVIMYDSWRKDAKWWEAGLESPEVKFPPYQDEAEEIEEYLRK